MKLIREIALLVAAATSTVVAGPSYSVTPLGAPADATGVDPTMIARDGTIYGLASRRPSYGLSIRSAVVWQQTEVKIIATTPAGGGDNIEYVGDGIVVGSTQRLGDAPKALLIQNEQRIILQNPYPTPGIDLRATHVNADGDASGFWRSDIDGSIKGILWRNGSAVMLNDFVPASAGANGVVPGLLSDWEDDHGPAIWREGKVEKLPPIPGAMPGGTAMAILDNGDVLSRGVIRRPDGEQSIESWLFNGAGYERFAPLDDTTNTVVSRALPNGHAVGFSGGRAVFWDNFKPTPLDAYLPPDSGWQLLNATDMSPDGTIVGFGKYNGQNAAFVMTPTAIPLPPAVLSTLTLVPAFLGWTRLRKRAAKRGN